MNTENGRTDSSENTGQDKLNSAVLQEGLSDKHQKTRQIMAWIAIVIIVVSIITACVCMIAGNINVGMAAFFCLVVIPIIMYLLIWVYDRVHKGDKVTKELLEAMEEQNDEMEG